MHINSIQIFRILFHAVTIRNLLKFVPFGWTMSCFSNSFQEIFNAEDIEMSSFGDLISWIMPCLNSLVFIPHFNFENSLDFTCFRSKNRTPDNFSKFFHLHKETLVCKTSLYIASNSSWNKRHLKNCSIVTDNFFIAFFVIVRLHFICLSWQIKNT